MDTVVRLDKEVKVSKPSPDMSEYRESVRKAIETELKNLIDEELRLAANESIEEQRKAIMQLVEEHRLVIREVVEEIGGGVAGERSFKAVQIGGPSGGCVPSWKADTPIDFESLNEVGAMMGSGGLVVLDDTDCMVDIARYFLTFTQNEACGKCSFGRIGTKRMLEILEKITTGKEQIIGGHILEEISKNTHSPGEALNVLGVCLAIYTYKAKKGEEYEITVKDARQWSYRNMPKD